MTTPKRPVGRPRKPGAKRHRRAAQVRLTPEVEASLERARAVVAARLPHLGRPSDAAVIEVALEELGRMTLTPPTDPHTHT